MYTVSRILVATITGTMLIGCGSEIADTEGTREALATNNVKCYKQGDAACDKAPQCVLEHTCSTSSHVCSISTSPDNVIIDNCPPPVCESKCRHWKNAACDALDKKLCGKRNDCRWDCFQAMIGCPSDMPDCGVYCGCSMKNPPSEPPLPGPPGVSTPSPGGEAPQVPAY